MGYESKEVSRLIRVQIMRHKATGLMVGVSDDLKGLMVAGNTEDEIEARMADAIREILEEKGERILSVTVEPDRAGVPEGFSNATLIANARFSVQ